MWMEREMTSHHRRVDGFAVHAVIISSEIIPQEIDGNRSPRGRHSRPPYLLW